MADHEFVVNFKVVRSESEAAQKAEAQGYREIERTADRTAKAVEDTTRKTAEVRKKATAEALSEEQLAAKVREELIRRENAARLKAAADAMDAAKKTAEEQKALDRDAAESARKAAREAADAARKAAREQRAQERADRAAQRAEIRAARDAEIQSRREIASAERQAAKEARDARRAARAQEIADNKKRREEQRELAESMGATEKAGAQFAGILGQIGNAAFGINGIASVISAIADSFERARSQAEEAGKMASEYRDALKEIAALKGQNAPDAGTIKGQLEFRTKTLQSAQDARAVQEAFLNVSGVSTDTADTKRRMTKETAEKAMVFAGQMHARLGGDAGAFGALAGMIPTMEGGRVEASDIARRMVQMQQIGEKGAASPADFAKAMGESSGLVTTGAFQTRGNQSAAARMAALGSAISITTPKEITTGLQQIHKITGSALFDTTPGPGAEMSPSDYLTSLGVTNQMDDLEILQKMFRDVERAEAESAKRGEQLNMTEYLKKRGFTDVQDTQRFKNVYGARADLEKTFIPMAEKNLTIGQATAPFKDFSGSVQGMTQKSKLSIEQQQIGAGIGAGEYYQNLQRQAFATAQSRGQMAGNFEDWKGSVALQEEMRNILRGEGQRAGLGFAVGAPNEYGQTIDPLADLIAGPGSIGSREQQEAFYRRGIQIKQAGGDPMGANSPIMREWSRRLDDQLKTAVNQEKLLTQINNKLNPPAVGVAAPGGVNAGPVR